MTPGATFKPWYHKTPAFAVTTIEQPEVDSEPAGSDTEGNTEVEEVESISEEAGGTYLPEFLSESPIGGEWSINVKMANAIQANEQFKKRCFECNSPDHFIKDCPQAKMVEGPKSQWGLTKTNWLQRVEGKDFILYAHCARAATEIKSGGEVRGRKLKGFPTSIQTPFNVTLVLRTGVRSGLMAS